MKVNAGSKLLKGLSLAALAIVVIGITAAPAVHAKSIPRKAPGNPANAVAHVEVPGHPVTRMLLVTKNGKEYLLLGLSSSPHVAIMDVSEPDRPRIIATNAGAPEAPAGELSFVADALTLFRRSDAETAASSGPKEIRGLPGVTAFTKDNAHGLIYFTKGDGLWIVKTNQRANADASLPNYANAS